MVCGEGAGGVGRVSGRVGGVDGGAIGGGLDGGDWRWIGDGPLNWAGGAAEREVTMVMRRGEGTGWADRATDDKSRKCLWRLGAVNPGT